jgi:hypothetical protein
MGRASISRLARRNAWTARGLAMVRWYLANQRQKRGSPARLGANMAAMASVPQSRSNWASSASATAAGTPIG